MKTELLAPAGSFETMKAAMSAGADAVYLGGQMFGARAYAGNLNTEELLEAIDYAHLHGKRMYLTVNTLVKERELQDKLYEYLAPLYRQGLDAVIVQDYGVMSFVREAFPELAVHASTQMTMSGPESAKLLEKYGATRIVTPRELSLGEIREIRKAVNLEIESFIHGALCYCYSGQCLMSSLIGGRSGNRGRCAQPCRLNYLAYDEAGKALNREQQSYLLSPKDMNTIAILPEIIEAGVTSLKIEGRMKKPEYTAGVVSVYRKYLDRYLEYGAEGYHVKPEDQKILFDLFNRNGFHESYYKQKNGRNMITLEKPAFREDNPELTARIRRDYIEKERQEAVTGYFEARAGEPMNLTVICGETAASAYGEVPEAAKNAGATEDSIRKQLQKTGGSPFDFSDLQIFCSEGLFLPVSRLNSLRREAFAELERSLTEPFRRELPEEIDMAASEGKNIRTDEQLSGGAHAAAQAQKSTYNIEETHESAAKSSRHGWSALVNTEEQLNRVLRRDEIGRIYLESTIGEADEFIRAVSRIHSAGAEAFLALPHIDRPAAKKWLDRSEARIREAGFDGFLIRSLEELSYCKRFPGMKVIADSNLYCWNSRAKEFLAGQGIPELTAPAELNSREYREIAEGDMEFPVYGRAVMMVSAQCIRNTTTGCTGKAETIFLKDRMNKLFPVRNICRYCYNLIYNASILSLEKEKQEIRAMGYGALRLSFTLESGEETEKVLDAFLDGKEMTGDLTRGHWKRGVE